MESFCCQLYEGLGPILTIQYIDKTQERAKSDIFYSSVEDFVVSLVIERLFRAFCSSTKNRSCVGILFNQLINIIFKLLFYLQEG